MKLFLVAMIWLTCSDLSAQFDYDISKIKRKAEKLKSNKEQYKTYLEAEELIWDRFFQVRNSLLHVKPSLPAFRSRYIGGNSLDAPVAYYYLRLEEERENIKDYGLVPRALLEGLAYHEDKAQSQQLLFYLLSDEGCPHYYKDRRSQMRYAISTTADAEWVNNYLNDHLWDTSAYSGLNYVLIKDWAEQLSESNKAKAEKVLRKTFNRGPSNGDGERFYKLLYRLHPKKTQLELLSYWNKKDTFARGLQYYNYYMFSLLVDFKTENTKAAKIVDKYRQNCENPKTDFGEKQRFNSLFFFLNPKLGTQELRETFELVCTNNGSFEDHYFRFSDFYRHFKVIFTSKEDQVLMANYVCTCKNLPNLAKYEMMGILFERNRGLFDRTILQLKELSLKDRIAYETIYSWSLNLVREQKSERNERLLKELNESVFWDN